MSQKWVSVVIAGLLVSVATTSLSQTTASSVKPPSSKRQAATAWGSEGLISQTVKGLDAVYARPGANLSVYKKVRLGPIAVAFRRHWEKDVSGLSLGSRVRPEQAQRIKDKLAALVRDEMIKQLKLSNFELVTAPGDDVLDVNLSITDLYVNAPDLPSTGRSAVYAVSAGDMTLIAELRDSATSDIVARVYDHAYATETVRPMRITNIDNEFEARKAASQWAKMLTQQLVLAHGTKGVKP